jgi:DNA-binding LacI/PurR family transcriptional regulator
MITSASTIGLDDIAKRTGVAVSTVSRALRDLPGIHPKTRSKVLREARALGYTVRPRRHESARMETKHVLALTVGDETPAGYMTGLSQASLELDISLHFHHVAEIDSRELLAPQNLPMSLREELISGVILIYRWPNEVGEKIFRKFPTVSIVHTYPNAPVDVMSIDHTGGMLSLVRHLKATGHHKLGFLGWDAHVSWSRSRLAAFLEAAFAHRIKVSPENLLQIRLPQTPEQIHLSSERIVAALSEGVSGWICADDFIGYDLCAELLQRGIRIPEEISITGYHRHPSFRRVNLPLLTSTEVDSKRIGYNALQQLSYRMGHPKDPPQLVLMPAKFAPGQTTPAETPLVHESSLH